MLRLGLGVEVEVEAEVEVEVAGGVLIVTGLDFWASFSVRLIVLLSCDGTSRETSYCPVKRGGLVSFTSGIPPAIDVSGMPEFLGGAGGGSRVCGRYAATVCNSRFDESRTRPVEEKFRAACEHNRDAGAAVEEANLNTTVDDDANGKRRRGSDMLGVCEEKTTQVISGKICVTVKKALEVTGRY